MSGEPLILRRGKAFHRRVQQDWEREAEGDPVSEFTTPFLGSTSSRRIRKGRLDIFVGEHDGMVAVVEIKGTDWDRVRHVRRLLGAHRRQVWKYVDPFLEDGLQVSAGIIYPTAPKTEGLKAEVEDYLNDSGLQVVWYDDPTPRELESMTSS